jgi:hypothetical protein
VGVPSFVIPPDNRSVGSPNPPQDVNQLSDMEGLIAAVLAQWAGYLGGSTIPGDNAANVTSLQTVLGDFVGPGLAPVGNSSTGGDGASINTALGALAVGQSVLLQPGTYYLEEQVVIPNGTGLACVAATPSFGIPIANYGVGGLPIQGAILKPVNGFANPNSGTGVIYINSASGQGGGQQLYGISMDCSTLPNGNNLHGVLVQNNVACIRMANVTIYGGNGQLGGDCLHCVASTGQPPDLLSLFLCHFAAAAGWGVTMSGVADSYIVATEATANKLGNWNITNGNNTRFIGTKGETSGSGPGYLFTAGSGFTGVVHLIGATSQSNDEDGFRFTGSGTGTYQLIGCSDDGSGTNGGSGGGGFSGLNVNTFAGVVLGTGWNSRVSGSPAAPEYGVSMTSSNVLSLQGGANVAGATAAYLNGGGNTSFIGTTAPGGYLCTPTVYSATNTFTTTSTTYAALSSTLVNTGAFTAPPSGSVLVQATFVVTEATAATVIGFALAAHGTVTPLVADAWQRTPANQSVNDVQVVPFVVTGLTAGTSYTFDLLFASTTQTLTIKSQAFTGTTLTATTEGGPIIMTVQAI